MRRIYVGRKVSEDTFQIIETVDNLPVVIAILSREEAIHVANDLVNLINYKFELSKPAVEPEEK